MIAEIGSTTMNISFALYFIVYIPQILHNQKPQNIAQLSLWLHFLLYISCFFDLLYGVTNRLPWQYQIVSTVTLTLVSIQHLQLINYFMHQQRALLVSILTAVLIFNLALLYCFFKLAHGVLDTKIVFVIGVIARLFGIVYCLPQLMKNNVLKAANGMSTYFIYLNLSLALLDTISSWCLDWGWPNKIAAPINIVIMLSILWQTKKYDCLHKKTEEFTAYMASAK
ncbi:MAG: PQ-loop repeat-containing protein [Legionellaceae bacterium]|nr:PQ-loop repeat-containing protein [Legionellaceae bacterium]